VPAGYLNDLRQERQTNGKRNCCCALALGKYE
jgi:hypothetical protein